MMSSTDPATATAPDRAAELRTRLVPPMPGSAFWGWAGPLLVTLFGGFLRFDRLSVPHAVVFDETYYAGDAWGILKHGTEIMHVTAGGGTTALTVTRGQEGTTAAASYPAGTAVQDIQDWAYLSVSATGADTGCTGACLYNYSVTTTTSPTGSTTGIAATGGTSGIVIDNELTGTGESQIYYSTLANQNCTGTVVTGTGTGTCAVQTSQSAP